MTAIVKSAHSLPVQGYIEYAKLIAPGTLTASAEELVSLKKCSRGFMQYISVQIQSSLGFSDYVRRDMALKHLIQPLAGEYGMHNGQEQGTSQLFYILCLLF